MTTVDGRRTRQGSDALETFFAVTTFLTGEAHLLDSRRYAEWLDLLTDDVRYRMPVRLTLAADASVDGRRGMAHFDEDKFSLTKRVQRLLGEYAWTENPPSRTRRFVSNVRVLTAGESEVEVASYLLLFRSRLDVREPEWLSAERVDTLRRYDAGFSIARREIAVDESVLRTQNLAVFL